MNPIRLLVASCVLAVSVAAPGAHAQPRYSLTPIPVGPFFTTGAFGLNDAGHVIGLGVPLGPKPSSAFYWSPETGTVSLGEQSAALGINNADTVVGYHPVPPSGNRAFTWNPSDRVFHDIPDTNQGGDINDAGQVLYRAGGPSLADQQNYVRNADGTARFLPNLAGAQYVVAMGLNSRGDAVGRAIFPAGGGQGAVYWPAAGGVQRLADVPGLEMWGASAANGRGQVIGLGFTPATATEPRHERALLWDTAEGTVVDLGTVPGGRDAQAIAINEAGEVVGSGTGGALLWTPTGGMVALESLLDASGQGWTLNSANGINNRGQIVATGIFNDIPQVVLLTPLPEPAALTALPLAGLALLRRRRRS